MLIDKNSPRGLLCCSESRSNLRQNFPVLTEIRIFVYEAENQPQTIICRPFYWVSLNGMWDGKELEDICGGVFTG